MISSTVQQHDTPMEYTPSDAEFDRSKLNDSQFIEQLIFENKELKCLLNKQNRLIEKLHEELKRRKDNNNSSESLEEPAKPVIPLRPHKLLPAVVTSATNKSSTSPVSLKSPRSIPPSNFDDIQTSPIRRHQSPIRPPFNQEEKLSSASPNQIPMRSSRRRENELTKQSSSSSLGSGADKNISASILDSYTAKSSTDSILSPYENNNSSGEGEKQENGADETIEQDHEKYKENTLSATTTIDASTVSANRVYSQDRSLTRSSSSVGSTYKSSRIKLPGNKEFPETLKSPNVFVNLPRYETPPNQTPQTFTLTPTAAATTTATATTNDAFKDNSIGMNVTNIAHPLVNQENEGIAKISSPLQGTFTHNSPSLAPPYETDTRQTFTTPKISSHGVYNGDPQTPGSSFNILTSPHADMDDSSLFIKPEEFNTIFICVVSTITVNSAHQTSKKSDDPNITMTINDRETNKEMWRIRKTYSQMMAFDNEIRPIIEYFGLANLPEKAIFLSTTPAKIEVRRSIVQNYFNTIFHMPHIPHMVVFRICKYLSLDFVNPLDDFKSGACKEGFLIRRSKGLGSNWKIRWCQVDGPFLEIYENPGGAILEQIKLVGAQIGRQSSDSVAEDKGYRHAFVIMEPHKSSKLQSSPPKHFFCAETDEERDSWVEALIEFTEDDYFDPTASPAHNSDHTFIETPSSRYEEEKYSSGQQHSTVSFDQISTNTSFSNEEISIKETKKAKKRSIFPSFGRNNNKTILENSNDEIDHSTIQEQPHLSDIPMQHYLNQLALDDDVSKSIFGRNVELAFDLSNHEFMGKQIPSICYRCLDYLNKTGAIFEEGIFRLSGSASTIRQLKDQFNTQYDLDLLKCNLKPDIHTVAGLFKSYLRELPNPIIGQTAYAHLSAVVLHNTSTSPSSIAMIFRDYFNNEENVDKIHYDLTFVIFKFLRQVISQNPINRMNLRNVCIVFVPTLNISIEVLSVFLVDFECIFENGKPISDSNREVLDLHIPNF